MKIRTGCLLVSVIFALGCGNISPHITNSKAARSYSGTASVGDFLSITLDPAVHTFSYTNLSNGDVGNNIPYIVNPDGTYTLQDPQGNLVAAYEVPSFGLLLQATKAGPTHNTPALITAIAKGSNISTTSWANQSFNYMQFRTAAGGMEIGSVVMDALSNVSIDSYWPFGASIGQTTFKTRVFCA